MDAFTLRTARVDDVPWIVDQEGRPDFAAFIHRWPAETHMANLTDPDKRTLIAEAPDGQRLAYVILAGLGGVAPAIELVRMLVAEPGRGLGHALMAQVMATVFSELGAARLWLDVFEDNARARHVYRRAGFQETEDPRQAATKADGEPGRLVIMEIVDAATSAGR